jgi:hypothetical protein
MFHLNIIIDYALAPHQRPGWDSHPSNEVKYAAIFSVSILTSFAFIVSHLTTLNVLWLHSRPETGKLAVGNVVEFSPKNMRAYLNFDG